MDRYTRLAPSGSVATDAGSRVVRYVFSDESVGRDGHIVKANAWQTENFNANPVFLWQHDDDTPPIGRVFGLTTVNRELRGAVKYAETEFADNIYQLVRGDFLSAVSTSWQPLKYDRMPNGKGLVFTSVDLLEISQVCIGALPTALATARSRINTKPLYEWASRALDTGRFGTLERPLVEAVCRAARPATSYSTSEDRIRRARELQAKGAPQSAEDRLRRARELQSGGNADMRAADDRARYDRYRTLRDGYGFTLEQAAYDLGISVQALRLSVARELQRGNNMSAESSISFESRKFTEADKGKLRQVNRYLAKAIRHHGTLEEQHGKVSRHVRAAHDAHRKLTSTLAELGEGRSARTTGTLAALGYDHHRITRTMADLGRALDGLTAAHGDAEDTAGSAQDCVRQASNYIDGVVGSESDGVH